MQMWLIAFGLVCGITGRLPAAAPGEVIVLEPSDVPNPPVTQLTPDSPPQPWNPLEIGDFTLVDQNGETVTQDDLLGTPWVASFIFTHCAYQCPAMCRKIMEIKDRVQDRDVRFVSITVDPERDDVARMAEFASIFGAEPPKWLFLTGSKEEIYRLIRKGFKVAAWEQFGTERLPGMEFAHSMALIHVDADGRIIGKYNSTSDEELAKLERVLLGRMETPPENRPIPPGAIPDTSRGEEIGMKRTPPAKVLPPWAQRLPRTNASLNALATVLLLVGYAAIKAGMVRLHERMMLFAFATSVVFLGCYLTYHAALTYYTGEHGKAFMHTGPIRSVYFTILVSHVVLAAAVAVLVPITLYRAWRQQWDRHVRIARVTFPIWLYVSVTGVIIYGMLYHWPV